MRQVVLDLETTGISHELGHRVIEVGCVELLDRQRTGNRFHAYLNPQRQVDQGAFRIHGLSNAFLEDKPLFKDIAEDLIQFIHSAELIIHNAVFDVGFLNAELNLLNWPKTVGDYCSVCDTLLLAREKHPGQRNNLDALCKRYDISHSGRKLHGALLDAEILASVYLAMTGGQATLFDEDLNPTHSSPMPVAHLAEKLTSQSSVVRANESEIKRHQDFIDFLVERSGVNLWADL